MQSLWIWIISTVLSLTLTSAQAFGSRPARGWVNRWICAGRLDGVLRHRLNVRDRPLLDIDHALWRAADQGSFEVGVFEILNAAGVVVETSPFITEIPTGKVINWSPHLDVLSAYLEILGKPTIREASTIRFTHNHAVFYTPPGIFHVGFLSAFSPADRRAGYGFKSILELIGLSHVTVEMHLVYQLPFGGGPRKKAYAIEPEFTAAKKSYPDPFRDRKI